MRLEINNLKKNYGKKCVLDGITFKTDEQVIGLLGPNGAGKTTLLKILAGLLPCTAGEILFEKNSGKRVKPEKVRIGYLPQHFGLIKNYTLYEHMEYFACIKGMKKAEWGKEIDHILDMVHLGEMKHTKCGKLSGGMVRRAGIAQAFLGNPDIVLLDEPTTGLDPEERIRFQNLVSHFGRKCIVLVSTHILDDVARICNELLVMDKGNLLYRGKTSGLISLANDRVFVMTETESRHWQEYGINLKTSATGADFEEDGVGKYPGGYTLSQSADFEEDNVRKYPGGDTFGGESDNMVRFLYLRDGVYENDKAKKVNAQIEDGYMYLLKKSRK